MLPTGQSRALRPQIDPGPHEALRARGRIGEDRRLALKNRCQGREAGATGRHRERWRGFRIVLQSRAQGFLHPGSDLLERCRGGAEFPRLSFEHGEASPDLALTSVERAKIAPERRFEPKLGGTARTPRVWDLPCGVRGP